jgi:hypothetical protein
VWRGAWSNGTAYSVNDLVSYGGSTWIAIASGTAHQPDSSPTFWQVVASKGDTGPTGATGAAGDDGAGVPSGGSTGQFLKKNSGTNFDTSWADIAVQVAYSQTGAVDTGTDTIPFDDTVPQNTEGKEFMSASITPRNSANQLVIEVVFNFSHSTSDVVIAALFQDANANALKSASLLTPNVAGTPAGMGQIVIRYKMTAGTTSPITFKVRAGPASGGTLTFNGVGGARKLGGVLASSITIREYVA